MWILINIGILVIELGLIEEEVFHFQVVDCNNQDVIIFGADMNFSAHVGNKGKDRLILAHVHNKGKDILMLGIGPMQGLGEHLLTAEKCTQLILLLQAYNFVLSLHYN